MATKTDKDRISRKIGQVGLTPRPGREFLDVRAFIRIAGGMDCPSTGLNPPPVSSQYIRGRRPLSGILTDVLFAITRKSDHRMLTGVRKVQTTLKKTQWMIQVCLDQWLITVGGKQFPWIMLSRLVFQFQQEVRQGHHGRICGRQLLPEVP